MMAAEEGATCCFAAVTAPNLPTSVVRRYRTERRKKNLGGSAGRLRTQATGIADPPEIASHERRRLSADLHDGLGQGRRLASRSCYGASPTATNPQAVRVVPKINEIIGLVNHAIQSVRNMALGISPAALERGGLLSALERLTAWSRESYGTDVRLRLMIRSSLPIDESTATHLYLIAQEAINNAIKHGDARSVIVKLRTIKHLAYLSITDDGVGVPEDSAHGSGMGLKIMEYTLR